MNRRQLFLTTGLLAATGALATARRLQSFNRSPRLVTTKEGVYLLGAIEPVLTGKLTSLVASPEGRFVLVTQSLRPEPTPEDKFPLGESKLWLYDARRRTTKLLHRIQDDTATGVRHTLGGATWFPGGKRAVVSLLIQKSDEDKEIRVSYALVDIERSSLRWLSLPADILWNAQPVPGTSLLLFQGYSLKNPKGSALCFLSPEGRFTPTTQFTTLFPNLKGLSADGKSAIFVEFADEAPESKSMPKKLWSEVRIRDAQLTSLTEKPGDMQTKERLYAPIKLPLTLHKTRAKLTSISGRAQETSALWLDATELGTEKKYAQAFVAAECDFPQLLADLSAVIFVRDGTLYAQPLAALDRLAFEKLLKELALKSAKQIGTGLVMYAQDYDENLPHDPSGIKDAILPYVGNNEAFSDFVYSYRGSTELSKQGKLGETVLGYIPSPGGRAVIYGDGHVKWEPTL
ncbi:hypothetical protein [Armatimonas sp.]|uniref:hypothetical protein n=1 Tax=Armatimonas sp. TaxID=1872638 RepID=UPI00374FFAFC